jgi:hypothetical protein
LLEITLGYSRFDTDQGLAVLGRVYIPNKKLLSKTTVGSKIVKVYDTPKPPCRGLLESSISGKETDKLTRMRFLYNPVALLHTMHKAVNALMAAHRSKVTFSQ